ncbi:hypothetical protein EV648_1273 [Kribbella sp. VKM Ac-2568]|nr:hypothetical protein EV648_1273 [Kribbella sp. VKM Ac-2568]
MERLRRAIEVGWDPEARTAQYNAAAADKRAAEAGLKAVDPVPQLTADGSRAVVTQLGDMAKALDRADRNDLAELYETLGLAVAYDHRLQVAEVSITPALRGVKKCVRGGTRTLTTRSSSMSKTSKPAPRRPCSTQLRSGPRDPLHHLLRHHRHITAVRPIRGARSSAHPRRPKELGLAHRTPGPLRERRPYSCSRPEPNISTLSRSQWQTRPPGHYRHRPPQRHHGAAPNRPESGAFTASWPRRNDRSRRSPTHACSRDHGYLPSAPHAAGPDGFGRTC